MDAVLRKFHPVIASWFNEKYASATDIQRQAWPAIADGQHLLITAPTGSGKTLTAFLWSLNRFATGELQTGQTRILYISPLKALNNDIQRNLLTPLEELKQAFAAVGESLPAIRVQTRSGDTEPDARRRMIKHPPEILITTPESLNLLLSSKSGVSMLQSLSTVILDEIHGVVDSKRGTYLMSAVERLVPLSGEFQRISLSATVNPLPLVAEFVGGFKREGDGYVRRPVQTLSSNVKKHYTVTVRYPDAAANRAEEEKIWDSLAEDFVGRIQQNQSTLLFVNSRALCEKLTTKINHAAGTTLAYAHHGSLSREIRSVVESRLKEGKLAAIVATSTLEMGIDIGALDEVILIQSPGSVAATIQRIGRAGHGVGETSRCCIYPTHPQDFIEAAVLGKAVLAGDIEAVDYIRSPLDVLAQIIISMTGFTEWDLDELFAEVKRCAAFAELTDNQFELVINMLAGRYFDTHIRELKPKISVDRLDNTVIARRGALLSLYLSGGVIPDRGYFQLKHAETGAKIGDLDEEFVWEANVGKVFTFGTQHWQVKKITHNDVLVAPGTPTGIDPPFWKSESISRNFHYASRIGEFLEEADAQVEDPAFEARLATEFHLDDNAVHTVVDFLKRQREHTRTALPHRHHLLVEAVQSGPARASGSQIVLHTGWGAMVNRPFAMALEAAWEAEYNEQPEVHISNESIVVQMAHEVSAEQLLAMAPAADIERLLRHKLEGSGFFGARFRENSGRALLLSKGRFNERKPLWMSRLQSQKLLDATLKFEDFPIMLETWRSCLRDEFDLPNLKRLLDELASGEIATSYVKTHAPSPFAQSVAWDQINAYMYMDDRPRSNKSSRLNEGLLHEVAMTPGLRPLLARDICEYFEALRQRLPEGHQPEDASELLEWVKERTIIPVSEWQALTGSAAIPDELQSKLQVLGQNIVAAEDVDRIDALHRSGDAEDIATFVCNVLQYYGPVTQHKICAVTELNDDVIASVLTELTNDDTLVTGQLLEDSDDIHYCDNTNYEYLLRLQRSRAQVEFSPRTANELPAFLYEWQTRASSDDPLDHLHDVLTSLRCLPATASLWETELLPARNQNYDHRNLDLLFQEGAFQWLGCGETTLTLCLPGDQELLSQPANHESPVPDGKGRFSFTELLDLTGEGARELSQSLWQAAWQGVVTNDTFISVRKAIEHNFKVPEAASMTAAEGRRVRRGSAGRWRAAIPFSGNWLNIDYGDAALDLIEIEEQSKDRVRLLLDRYGIVCREVLQREASAFSWRQIYRSLRLMELGGEVLTGYFFAGIAGPQYIDPAAFRTLQRFNPGAIFWLNATDPLCLSGTGLLDNLPRRVPGNYVVYDGGHLAMTLTRRGKTVSITPPDDCDDISPYLDVFHHLLYRSVNPMKKVVIEEINGGTANNSEYLPAFESRFNLVRDFNQVYLQRTL